ncbi:hypothetical protein Cgig2_021116 [Carnegiea gigantea]|uniref:Uncharacterized protein n=1 Tax=Carnegiea gigantea TaxID=171969 RepID=A0A9Q1Q8Q4_9CARY|nr:hypothetical protein Cgig2_021116 [Carnegiea gigantea]
MVEREGLMEAFDIDPTPAQCYTPHSRYIYSGYLQAIEYSGWTTYLHVLPVGRAAAKVDVTLRTVQWLDGVIYNIELQSTESRRGVPQGIPLATTTDVQICRWNYRAIPKATFRPNLFTMRTTTDSPVVILTKTLRWSATGTLHVPIQGNGYVSVITNDKLVPYTNNQHSQNVSHERNNIDITY